MAKKDTKNVSQKSTVPPVVTVLGHVDHGKTSLLDAIRKTNIVSRESGGITQAIGASSIETLHEGQKRRITFIDTPGHAAFSAMRSRGAQVADIGLLIVSLADGVMPQTKESISLLQAAKLPFIVVLTKADLPDTNAEKVKQQLLKENVMLEGYGGDVPLIAVSAKTGQNVKELLDLILLVFAMQQKVVSPDTKPRAIVIESRLDQKSGPKATIVVKNGSFALRDEIVCEGISAKIRMMVNDLGKGVDTVTVGEAVEILGFAKVPPVGAVVYKKEDAVVKASVAEAQAGPLTFSLDIEVDDTLSLIIVADTQGSLEAITGALPPKAKILLTKTGEITSADVLFAKSVKGLVLGFNTRLKPDVVKLAATEKVLTKNYTIIYEMLDEIKDVLEGKRLALVEEILGKAKILASFPFEKSQVLGIGILEGRVARGDKARLMHGEEIVGESTISSIRQGKNTVSKAEAGQEAGILLSPPLDFTIGDMLLSHN